MQDTISQYKNGVLYPYSEQDKESLDSEYKNFQLVRTRTTRIPGTEVINIEQNGLLHACFKLVADNCGNSPHLRTPELVKMSCKIGIDFIHDGRMPIAGATTLGVWFRSYQPSHVPYSLHEEERNRDAPSVQSGQNQSTIEGTYRR